MNRVPTYVLVIVAVLIVAAAVGVWTLSNGSRAAQARLIANSERVVEKTEPKLVAFTEGKPIPTGMKNPRGIALGRLGELYVVGDMALVSIRPDGKRYVEAKLGKEPTCVAADPDSEDVYIGAVDGYERISGPWQTGKKSFGPRAFISSISVGRHAVWVADAGQRIVHKCDRVGKVLARFGKKDETKGVAGLVVPSPYMDVVAAGDGVWVANTGLHRLELYGPDGKIERSWGEEGFQMAAFCGCCNPAEFAVFADGRFVTSEKGFPRVKVYGADGKFISVVAGPESFAEDDTGLDLATTRDGRVLVLDPMRKTVRVFIPKEKAKS